MQVPDDPGEEIVMMTVGLSNALGAQLDQRGQPNGLSYQLIIESSFAWYDRSKSAVLRPGGSLFMPGEVDRRFPETSFMQLNLGIAPLEVFESDARLGPAYMELQRTFIYDPFMASTTIALAAGYTYHPALRSHGPQLTASFLGNVFSVRGAYFLDQGMFIGATLNIKLPAVMWVGSQ